MQTQTAPSATGKALGFMMFGVAAGLSLDLCAKALLETYSLNQFVLLRSLIGLLMFLALAPRFGGLGSLRTRRSQWHALRTLLAAGSMFGCFYGLSRMPLVNTLTLAFTAPLTVTALSVPILGEQVGWRRWSAICVGFGGVLSARTGAAARRRRIRKPPRPFGHGGQCLRRYELSRSPEPGRPSGRRPAPQSPAALPQRH